MTTGAEFSDIQPRNNAGRLSLAFQGVPTTAEGLDNGEIFQVTQNNVFRLGQQVFFWLGISNEATENDNFLTRVRLKPWWARPASEYRQAFGGSGIPSGDVGVAQPLPVDSLIFGVGTQGDPLKDNRVVWMPSPKRQDVVPEDTAPPPVPPARNSDSVFLDDLWTVDMPSPLDAAYAAKFNGTDPQVIARWVPIMYPAFGYALGFTYEITVDDDQGDPVPLRISLSWSQGTFGSGRIQESVG